jgi:hypothetical protein
MPSRICSSCFISICTFSVWSSISKHLFEVWCVNTRRVVRR